MIFPERDYYEQCDLYKFDDEMLDFDICANDK